jgi:hypothetical protein
MMMVHWKISNSELVNGTDAYEKNRGDRVSYRTKNGRTASLTLHISFKKVKFIIN